MSSVALAVVWDFSKPAHWGTEETGGALRGATASALSGVASREAEQRASSGEEGLTQRRQDAKVAKSSVREWAGSLRREFFAESDSVERRDTHTQLVR